MNEKKTPFFERFANVVTKAAGSSIAFIVAFLIVVVWAVSGPFFHYSESWQLVINTGTTIITFLMVFLIQKSQNKESKAIQLKLNELISSARGASNRLVNIEDMDEKELDELHSLYLKLAELSKERKEFKVSKSIENEIQELDEKVEKMEEDVDEIKEKVEDLSEKLPPDQKA